MKNIQEKIVNLIPHFIFVVLISSIIITIFYHGLSFDNLLDLIRVLIWPSIIFCAAIFFRKVFTYFFLSLEEFNFFGNKGHLDDIRQVIIKRASELRENEKVKERYESENTATRLEFESFKKEKDEKMERVLSFAEKVVDENVLLKKQSIESNNKIEALNLIIQKLNPNISEEKLDVSSNDGGAVGSTNPLLATSEKK